MDLHPRVHAFKRPAYQPSTASWLQEFTHCGDPARACGLESVVVSFGPPVLREAAS